MLSDSAVSGRFGPLRAEAARVGLYNSACIGHYVTSSKFQLQKLRSPQQLDVIMCDDVSGEKHTNRLQRIIAHFVELSRHVDTECGMDVQLQKILWQVLERADEGPLWETGQLKDEPFDIYITKDNINSMKFIRNNRMELMNKETHELINVNEFLVISIIDFLIINGETKITVIGFIEDLASEEEIKKYYDDEYKT